MTSLIIQQPLMRWKEWIPLVTQQVSFNTCLFCTLTTHHAIWSINLTQASTDFSALSTGAEYLLNQRLRNVIKIIGYNMNGDKTDKEKELSYYYTLHLSTMCAPFYTSEKVAKDNPIWSDVNFNSAHGSVNGVVIRIWQHYNGSDSVVTIWGIYFSGLSYIGPQLYPSDSALFCSNTIVFYMHGGYFTSSDFVRVDHPTLARITAITVSQIDVRNSYTLESLSRLHSTQRLIKEISEEATIMHDKILTGDYSVLNKSTIRESSPFLRKLLNQSKPTKIPLQQVFEVRKTIESTKFRVQLIQEEISRKQLELRKLSHQRNKLDEYRQEEECELLTQYHMLNKNMECLREKKRAYFDMREILTITNAQFTLRQKQLVSELSYIYPIYKISDGKYTICNVHLPNSEDFAGCDELPLTVSLGFTSHLIQMISYIINVPLRYPIIHLGSNSKIADYITDKLPEKEREFNLFARSKDRLKFDYGVYLLNKNIAQLRWYCGLGTTDLRTTLSNLESLFYTCFAPTSSIEGIQSMCSERSLKKLKNTITLSNLKKHDSVSLSYSLDKGLDRWDGRKNPKPSSPHGSEPSLSQNEDINSNTSSLEHEYGQNMFLHALRENGVVSAISDDDQHSSFHQKC